MAPASGEATRLLDELRSGDGTAATRLWPLVYDELRSLAAAFFRQERRDHTLQPTALVHEAYLRLVVQDAGRWSGRAHFFAVAAKAMRNILVNHAQARNAIKRGAGTLGMTIDSDLTELESPEIDPLELDQALIALAALDERKARVVELRFFGGLSVEEAAEVLGVSISTIESDWRLARAWLSKELEGE